MQVNKDQFLQTLQSVSPGLSPREIIEQSSCFVFKDKMVMTFNDEVACFAPCELKLEGAVQAAPMMQLLLKLDEEVIEVRQTDKQIQFKGKGRMAGVLMDQNVLLPIEAIERPKEKDWKGLPKGFEDAINMVEACASRDDSQYKMTCIHIHPKWVEASDDYRMARFTMKTGFPSPVLVRQKAIQNIINQGMIEFSETKNWVHFRRTDNIILACRKSEDKYPNVTKHLKASGNSISLPKSLVQATEKAEVFSSDDPDGNLVSVKLEPGKLSLNGTGPFGWYRETRKAKYKGPSISFQIPPKQLCEILKREQSEYEVTDKCLKVSSGRFVFITSILIPKE